MRINQWKFSNLRLGCNIHIYAGITYLDSYLDVETIIQVYCVCYSDNPRFPVAGDFEMRGANF